MTINTQDLIKVDHPGDASIWTSPPSYSTINGKEVQNFSPLYWEDANDEVISLLDGQGAQLGLQGRKFILSNNTSATCCYYPYEFTGAWLLETN